MSSEEIFEKIKNIIVEQLQVAETAVTEDASFIDENTRWRCRKGCYCRGCS